MRTLLVCCNNYSLALFEAGRLSRNLKDEGEGVSVICSMTGYELTDSNYPTVCITVITRQEADKWNLEIGDEPSVWEHTVQSSDV
jgi:hypothetical protein